MDTYLDVLINNKYYTQRRPNSKIIRYDFDRTNPHYYNLLDELPLDVKEEIEKILEIRESPEEYFVYEVKNKEVKICSIRKPDYVKNVEIPDEIYRMKVTKISHMFFMNTHIERLTIGKNVEELPPTMCHGCKNLQEVILPEHLTCIPMATFMGCKKLEKINTENIQFIDDDAFRNCESLKKVNLNSVAMIESSAFQNATNLEIVELPWIRTIYCDAFRECANLKMVIFGNNLSEIKPSAFKFCKSLTTLYLPDSLKKITNGCFAGCEQLFDVRFPANLETISYQAFAKTRISSISIPNSVKLIEEDAFSGVKFNKIYLSKNTVYTNAFDESEIKKITLYD